MKFAIGTTQGNFLKFPRSA